MLRPCPTLLLLALLATPAAATAGSGCVVRQGAVNDDGLAEFVTECRWEIAPRFVAEVLRDPRQVAKANASISECHPLADGRVIFVYHPGWPFEERQATLDRRVTERESGGVLVEFRIASVQEPLPAGRIAVAVDEGSFEVTPLPDGASHLRYVMRYDPGGNLEPWFIRRFMRPNLESSLERIRGLADEIARRELAHEALPQDHAAGS
jgi:hypothetical protein